MAGELEVAEEQADTEEESANEPSAAGAQAALPAGTAQQRAGAEPWLARHLPAERGPQVDSQQLLLRFLEAIEGRGVNLYPAQEEAILELFGGAHVVLDTPTGSGKSLVAVAACFHALGRGQRAYYTSPTKALVSEKFFDLCRYFGTASVGLATGDASVNTGAPLICCTAEVLTSISLYEGAAARIDCVVMDEFHYYGDAARGSAWELPLWRMPQAAFLLMSGTLGANPQLYSAIEENSGRPLRVVSSVERPVALDFTYSERSVRSTLEGLLLEEKYPVYVVHFSQREALETAKSFAEQPPIPLSDRQREALAQEVAGTSFDSPFGEELRSLLLRGVGLHHAGLLPRYRRTVERLAQASLLTIVCGTDTLGVGVNVPIRSVLLTRLCKFNGKDTSLLQPREFLQIAGRAGRKGFDDRGDVVAVAPEWQAYNEELRERMKQGQEATPKWKRPPRNYKHWTKTTFERLRTDPPAPLKSHFNLSMGQVLSVLSGASDRGENGRRELRHLVDLAQCSWRQRRFLHRQVEAFISVLEASGAVAAEAAGGRSAARAAAAGEGPRRVDSDPSARGESGQADAAEEASGRSGQRPSAFMDDSSLFLLEALPVLQEQVEPDSFHLAVVAAAESVCEAPTALRRRPGRRPAAAQPGAAAGACPEPLQGLLSGSFSGFCRRHPWVPNEALQPKGFALELVAGRLSFDGLVSRLTSHGYDSAVVIAEGGLLRYLGDVYRTLRLCVPDGFRSASVRDAERQLRSAVASVDSSLLREWEGLGQQEQGRGLEQTTEAPAQDAVGGAMVPRREPAVAGRSARSRAELEQRAAELRQALAERRRRKQEDEQRRARHPMRRAGRTGLRLWSALERSVQSLLDVVW